MKKIIQCKNCGQPNLVEIKEKSFPIWGHVLLMGFTFGLWMFMFLISLMGESMQVGRGGGGGSTKKALCNSCGCELK